MSQTDLPHVIEELSGWACAPRLRGKRYRPAKLSTLRQAIASGSRTPRGAGRAYGDAALPTSAADAAVVDMTALDRFLSFDDEKGVIRVEAGVTLKQLLSVVVPRGWFLPVVPGTAACTIGGMVAADVHGKNHPKAGSLQNVLCSIVLLLPSGEEVRCTPDDEPELFAATCGGMGLTGMIAEVELALEPITAAWIRTQTTTFTGLDPFLVALSESPKAHAVGWIDGTLPAASFGRSVLIEGDLATVDDYDSEVAGASTLPPLHVSWEVPRPVPKVARWLFGSRSVRLHNARYFAKARRQASNAAPTLEPLPRFFFPLDAKESWNTLYGDAGFRQYQFAVPTSAAGEMTRLAYDTLREAGHQPYLVVAKRLGEGHGMLSFPMPGLTIAMDLPHTPELDTTLDALDRHVCGFGGRSYLAKDARMSAATLRQMYPDVDRFLEVRRRVDPEARWSSALAERLELTGVAAAEGEGEGR